MTCPDCDGSPGLASPEKDARRARLLEHHGFGCGDDARKAEELYVWSKVAGWVLLGIAALALVMAAIAEIAS